MDEPPSSSPENPVSPQVPPVPPLQAAGFWIRAAAHGLDIAVLTLLVTPVSFYLALRMVQLGQDPMQMVEGMKAHYSVWWDISFSLGFLALVVLLWRTVQGTPGKKVCGLMVVDMQTGKKAASWKLTIRYLAYLVSILPLGLGLFWVLWHPHHYAWHDMISGTTVIHKSDAPSAS